MRTLARAPRSNSSGFTLVELLVVIGIIAILVGILVPTIGNARRMALNVSDKARISELSHAVEQFKADYSFYPGQDYVTAAPYDANKLGQRLVYPAFPGAPNGAQARLTGAQVLSAALFGYDVQGAVAGDGLWDPNLVAWKAIPNYKRYANLTADDLDITRDPAAATDPNAAEGGQLNPYYQSDPRPRNQKLQKLRPGVVLNKFTNRSVPDEVRPILYFPSRPNPQWPANRNNGKLLGTYRPDDNIEFLENGYGVWDVSQGGYVSGDPKAFGNRNWAFWRMHIANPTYGIPGLLEANSVNPKWNTATNPNLDDIDNTPYDNDSFLLISAGQDGLYLTDDDNLNFPNNEPQKTFHITP